MRKGMRYITLAALFVFFANPENVLAQSPFAEDRVQSVHDAEVRAWAFVLFDQVRALPAQKARDLDAQEAAQEVAVRAKVVQYIAQTNQRDADGVYLTVPVALRQALVFASDYARSRFGARDELHGFYLFGTNNGLQTLQTLVRKGDQEVKVASTKGSS